jgi:hypothetical protein
VFLRFVFFCGGVISLAKEYQRCPVVSNRSSCSPGLANLRQQEKRGYFHTDDPRTLLKPFNDEVDQRSITSWARYDDGNYTRKAQKTTIMVAEAHA